MQYNPAYEPCEDYPLIWQLIRIYIVTLNHNEGHDDREHYLDEVNEEGAADSLSALLNTFLMIASGFSHSFEPFFANSVT